MSAPLSYSVRVLALAAVLGIFGLVWLYTREFPVFSNTIGVRTLVAGAAVFGALAGGGLLLVLRRRLTPWALHLPEVFTVLLFSILFAPLFASLINRSAGSTTFESFEFISETPYLSSPYGLLKGEKIKPTGYALRVREKGRLLRFQYQKQAYYPLTRTGDPILLPVKHGLLGFRVVELR